MFCKWCGMESVTTDQCSWCHRPFTTAAESPARKTEAAAEVPAVTMESAASEAQTPALASPAAAPPIGGEGDAVEVKTPWDNTPVSEPVVPETASPLSAATPPPVIGVRRPAKGRGGAHIPAPAIPPRAASSSGAAGSSGARPPAPAPGISPGMASQRTPGSSSPARPHTPAPPIPAATRGGASPAASMTARTAEAPAVPQNPAAPASTTRTALPSSLLGGGRTATPASEAVEPPPAVSGGLADGVAIPPAVASADANVPQFGTFTPAKSKYYAGQVVDPVSGTHYDSDTGQPTAAPPKAETPADKKRSAGDDIEFEWHAPPVTMGHLVARFLGVFAILLCAGAAIAFFAPAAYVAPLLLVNFIGAVLMTVMRVVPWQDEDSDDVFLMIVLTLAFGPVVSLIIYSVLTALRQDGNPAMIGVMGVAALTRLGVGLAIGKLGWWQLMPFPLTGFAVEMMFMNWAGLVALAGWYFANVFHKFDE